MILLDAAAWILILTVVYGLWFLVGRDLLDQAIDSHHQHQNYERKYGKVKEHERSRE